MTLPESDVRPTELPESPDSSTHTKKQKKKKRRQEDASGRK